jgi:MFS family permease
MANRNLNLLLAGRFVSDTGTRMQFTILPLYILDMGGTAATMGTFSLLTMLPLFLLLPFGGVVGDRLNRKKIMVNSDLIAGTLILGLGVLAYFELVNLVLLIAVQMSVGIVSVFFESSSGGMIPSIVDKDDLTAANSKVATLRTMAGIFGPLAGAALYSTAGVTIVFVFNGISFLLSAVSEMFIRYTHHPKEIKQGMAGVFHDMKEGALFIKDNKLILNLCLYFFMIMTLIGPIFIIVLPLMFKSNLNYPDTLYGALQTFQMAGYLIGAVTVGIIGKKISTEHSLRIGNKLLAILLIPFSLVMFPFVYTYFGNSSIVYFSLYALTLLLLSSAFAFLSIPVQTIIQKTTPPEYMSRVYSIVGLISKSGMPIGAFVLGMVISNVSIHWTMVAITAVLIPVILIFNRGITQKENIPV